MPWLFGGSTLIYSLASRGRRRLSVQRLTDGGRSCLLLPAILEGEALLFFSARHAHVRVLRAPTVLVLSTLVARSHRKSSIIGPIVSVKAIRVLVLAWLGVTAARVAACLLLNRSFGGAHAGVDEGAGLVGPWLKMQ